MSDKIAEMKEVFKDSFMKPQCYVGQDIEYEILESGLDLESEKYYCRLSASGYLDCTEWSGPFDSVDECAEHLIDMYGDS